MVAHEDFDFARDAGLKRSFWRAANVTGEPEPAAPGSREDFVVAGVPDIDRLHFVVVSHDDSRNRSYLSNPARRERP